MKRYIFGLTGGFLVMTALMALSVGCTPKAAKPTQNVTGILNEVNTPAEAGKDTVTVQSPQGPQSIAITPDTNFTLDGKTCNFLDISKALDSGNQTYVCTVVYDDVLDAVAVYVKKGQEVNGTLKDVNTPAEAGKDTVTVQSPQGPQSITITPDTNFTLDGKTCNFLDISKALDSGNQTYVCTVVYDDVLDAVAVYVRK